jgi:hypothetical protein
MRFFADIRQLMNRTDPRTASIIKSRTEPIRDPQTYEPNRTANRKFQKNTNRSAGISADIRGSVRFGSTWTALLCIHVIIVIIKLLSLIKYFFNLYFIKIRTTQTERSNFFKFSGRRVSANQLFWSRAKIEYEKKQ